ncbi:endoribonuclease Dcr-1 [Maniola jurtina]|uniref:endoribonuclease Dcr-1 n=1 Tax=Maniola jurtina TaxID=191418 RepID=UPI001E68DE83|nr:endoribonuclease Dcr-1 [Maniola jurtina]
MESSCTRFTAAEGGARLAACAGSKNILVTEHTAFISTSVLIEHAYKIRGPLSSGSQRSVYITRPSRIECVSHELTILTDLSVIKAHGFDDVAEWRQELEVKEVLVCTSEVLQRILKEQIIKIPNINVLIIDSSHLIFKDENLQYIMKLYKQCDGIKPRILALTYPLFTAPKDINEQIDKNIDHEKDTDKMNEENGVEKEIKDEVSEFNDSKDDIDEGIDVKDNSYDEDNDSKDTDSEKQQTKDSADREDSKDKIKIQKQLIKDIKETLPEDDNKAIDKITEIQDTEDKSYVEKDTDCKRISKDIENPAMTNQNYEEINEKDNKDTEPKNTDEKIDENTEKVIDSSIDIDESIDKDDNVIDDIKIEIDNMDDFNLYEKLEWKIEELEKELCCDMDLAEDIDGGKRLSATLTKPKELIVECNPKLPPEDLPKTYTELEDYMRSTVNAALDFIDEHRYDPTEIYGDDMYEEFANIPDPTAEPKHILKEFLYVLDQLGPYAADKAAFSLLIKLEKLKIKVPYERHFLLLCLCTTVFVKIRCYTEILFSRYASDWDKITAFSTPKVLRLAEILEQFQPPENLKETEAKNLVDSTRNNNDNTINSNQNIKVVPTGVNINDNKHILDNCENVDKKNVSNQTVDTDKEMKRSKTDELLSAIEKCDFVSLGNKIEDRVNIYEANLKDLDDFDNTIQSNTEIKINEVDNQVIDSKSNESIDHENIDAANVCSKDENSKNTVACSFDNVMDSGGTKIDRGDKNTFDHSAGNVNLMDSVLKDSVINKSGNNVNSDKNTFGSPYRDVKYNTDGVNKDIDSVKKNCGSVNDSDRSIVDSNKLGVGKRPGHRSRGRGRPQRGNVNKMQQSQQNPDALCGIIFVKAALMAKIMFMMIVDMSRCRLSLSHLCAQYCASEGEGRDCQKEGKKQEEVLKKFRMHECNLLLATSVLEEGIDLPRCNLVVRWDVPPSYRSHGLCRSRARAPRASVALLASTESQSEALLHNLAVYKELDQIITRKCGCGIQFEPPLEEENHADSLAFIVKPYTPVTLTQNGTTTTQNGTSNNISHGNSEMFGKNDENSENIHENVKKVSIKDHRNETDSNLHGKKIDIGVTCTSFDETNREINENLNEISVSNLSNRNTFAVITDKVSDKNQYVETVIGLEGSSNSYRNAKPNVIDSNILANNEILKTLTNIPQNENNVANRLSKIDEDILNVTELNKDELTTKDRNSNRNIFSEHGVNIDPSVNNENVNIDINVNSGNDFRRHEIDENNEIIDENHRNNDDLNAMNQNMSILNEFNENVNNENEIIEKCTVEINSPIIENEFDEIDNRVRDENGTNSHENENNEIIDENQRNNDGIDAIKQNMNISNEFNDNVNNDNENNEKCIAEINSPMTIENSNKDRQEKINKNHEEIKEIVNVNKLHEENFDIETKNSEKIVEETNLSNKNLGLTEDDSYSSKEITLADKNLDFRALDVLDIDKDLNHENLVLTEDKERNCIESNVKYEGVKLEYKLSDSKKEESVASVDLNSAIALINRYCGKLPSDTFTRLAPQWWMEQVRLPDRDGTLCPAYVCTLRLPLNCPVKYNIVGHPMPTRVLARRMAALQACRILHKSGELDNQLMPIGKENFKAAELENNVACNEPPDTSDCARPGTTKRRQYYFKRTAWAFTDCQAIIDATDSEIEDNPTLENPITEETAKGGSNILYAIVSRLWCALPERYNTRGRRLHAPQNAPQAIGVLMARREPTQLQIPAFPVYTRSGEVRVSVEPALQADVRLSPRRARLIRRFMRFVFSDVLRVRRRGMKLQTEGTTHNNYYIVPTVKKSRWDGTSWIDVDWPFLELIYKHTEDKKMLDIEKPMLWEQDDKKREKEKDGKVRKMENPLLKPGEVFSFDAEKYKEAVVTPWYRNQDQPQFFLVAEICWKLSPDSAFPSAQHDSFRSYYRAKYGAELTQSCQPLLDVDHTSARLNLLTPRYVNRKGVALPVSSERTRRAKRDRLDQKQILVPELCRVHPFAAPLWFATVALPCVLYRINALLIADEIRRAVAIDVGLGIPRIDEQTCPGFQWPPLDFGWSLAEVLSADSEKIEKKKDEDESKQDENGEELIEKEKQEELEEEKGEVKEKTINDILQEKLDAENGFEIGTWSNDMASSIPQAEYDEFLEPLPSNLTFCTSSSGGANWSDPIEKPKGQFNPSRAYSVADSDCSYVSSDFDTDDSDMSDCSDDDTDTTGFCSSRNSNAAMGVRIEYKTAHEAEAVDLERRQPIAPAPQPDKLDDERDLTEYTRVLRAGVPPMEYVYNFRKSVAKHKKEIKENGNLITKDRPIVDLLPEPAKEVEKNSNTSIKDKLVNHNKANENLIHDDINDKENAIISPEEEKKIDILVNEFEISKELNESNYKMNPVHEVGLKCDTIVSENVNTGTQSDIKDSLDNICDNICDNRTTMKSLTTKNQVDEKLRRENCKDHDVKENLDIVNKETLKCNASDEKIKSTFLSNHNRKELNVNTEECSLIKDTEIFESKRKDDPKINEFHRKIDKTKIIDNKTKIDNKECLTKNIDKTKIADDLKTKIQEMFPYNNVIDLTNEEITLETIEKNKRYLLAELKKSLPDEEIKKLNCFSMKDVDIDSPEFVNEKVVNIGFDSKEKYQEIVNSWSDVNEYKPYYMDGKGQNGEEFDFDYQPDLKGHPGPSPSVILQALTMSNANDGINLERLETIGDSFLKFAITAYLYCAHPAVHEGKLSHMRSKQVSNLNLYRLGRNKRLGARMIASKFEPHDNWLPPCHKPPPTLQPSLTGDTKEPMQNPDAPVDSTGCFIPYNLITQHSIPDKSIADCVEALIGAYLLECGPRGALLFMSWLGIRVLPSHTLPLPDNHPYVIRAQTEKVEESKIVQKPVTSKPVEPISSDSCCSDDEETDPELSAPEPDWGWPGRPVGALRPYRDKEGRWMQPIFGELKAPPSPLLRYIDDPEGELEQMLSGYDALEKTLQYRFRDRSLLLQALTHASHQKNRLTDCYQRLEFLGDAILDYLITRHLYEDPRRHSPGALTDLRSALVNNTIFATLAARHGFHKYFRHMSPGLNEVLTKYVKIQEENGHSISEEHYLIQEDEMEQAEDVEVPKALGDLFESVAGAIFLDSGMSLGAVWRSVGGLLGAELDAFSAAAPKSPVRELLEAEPDTAKFGKPERLADGRRVRVCVEVFGRGAFKGIGRNYRIAKGTAARCALRHLRTHKPR